MTPQIAIRLNTLALYAITAILIVAFYSQMAYDELPCPLCLPFSNRTHITLSSA